MTDSTTPNPNASYWHTDGTERTLTEYRSAVAGDQGERVTFTTTGATGTVLKRFTRDGLGDLSGEWATVAFDDGETIDVVASSLTTEPHAYVLGSLPGTCRTCGSGADAPQHLAR